MSRKGHVETELQFEAPDLRWVERWLATCHRDDVTLAPQDAVWQEDEYLDSESFGTVSRHEQLNLVNMESFSYIRQSARIWRKRFVIESEK